MKHWIKALGALVLASSMYGQNIVSGNPAQVPSAVSGTPYYFSGSDLAGTVGLQYSFSGTPSGVSISVQWCARDFTNCTTPTPKAGANPYVTNASGMQQYPGGYDYLKVTPTFSGATLSIYKVGIQAGNTSSSSGSTGTVSANNTNNPSAPAVYSGNGGSTTVGPATSAAPLSTPLQYAPGSQIYADSRATGTGASNAITNGWAYLLQKPLGGVYLNAARSGDQALDIQQDIQSSFYPSLKTVNPAVFVDPSTNDVTAAAASASQANYLTTWQRIFTNIVYWGSIAKENKAIPAVSLTGFSTSGTWAQDTLFSLVDQPYVSNTNGNTITATITAAQSSALVIGYPIYGGGGGTFTMTLDGSAVTNALSGGTTFYASGDNGVAIQTTNNASYNQGIAAVRLGTVAAGSHTIVMTVTSSTSTSNKVGIAWVGQQSASNANPALIVSSTSHQNNANDTLAGTFAGYIATIATQAATDGGNVTIANVRDNMLNNNVAIKLNVNSPGVSYTAAGWVSDSGVTYAANGASLTKVASVPAMGQYAVTSGVYTFNALDSSLPLVISETANCGATLTNVYANCYADTLHYNDLGHAVVAATNIASTPAQYVTGNNVPVTSQPDSSYLANRIFPAQMPGPNGYNVFSPGPGLVPGIKYFYLPGTGQVYFTTFTNAFGITNVTPNNGSAICYADISYQVALNGAPPPTEAALTAGSNYVIHRQVTCNGIATYNDVQSTFNGKLIVNNTGGSQNAFSATNNAIYGTLLHTGLFQNLFNQGSTLIGLRNNDDSQNYSIGVGGTSETTRSVSGHFYVWDDAAGAIVWDYNKANNKTTSMAGPISPTQLTTTPEQVAFSATPTFSALKEISRIALTGNVTSSTLAAGADGAHKTFIIVQDTTARTFAWPTNVVGGMTIGTTVSKRNVQSFVYSASDSVWVATSTGVINQ